MFSKNNLKYILILAIGFLWCSSVYLTQEQYLLNYMSDFNVYIVDMLFGSFSMALGIFLFGFLYKKKINIKRLYFVFVLVCILLLTTFFIIESKILLSIILCLICAIGTAGFGAGYHFSLVASNVDTKYRGRVFAIGYSIGTIGTYLLTLLPKTFLLSGKSIIIYIPLMLLSLILVYRYGNIKQYTEEKNLPLNFKKYKYILFTLVFLMALVTSFSSNMFALHNINTNTGFAYSRLYYAIGLIVAGFIADLKSREYLDILTIVSLFFSLLSILLLKESVPVEILSCLNYMFIGAFVIFRTTSFMNLKDKSYSLVYLAGFGLLISRVAEGLLATSDVFFEKSYIFLVISIVILLSLILFIYIIGYYKMNEITDDDVIKDISVKYVLSIQEQKVLYLLINGYSNQEMADKLFLSINTIKTHIGNIYKKTGKRKKELQAELLIIKKK